MNSGEGKKEPFLHRGRRYLGLWILPGEHDVISEASYRLGLSKNAFIMQAVADKLLEREFKDLAKQLSECKTLSMRARAESYAKAGRDFKTTKKSAGVDPNGSVVL